MRHSRQQIERELRQRIRELTYPPGTRMPSRRQLQEELGGSPMTMQEAFDQLAAQGYIEPHGRLGTFVAKRLPEASIIALVFQEELDGSHWNRFWSALHRVAACWTPPAGATASTFRSYHLPGGHLEGTSYQRLCTDLDDGALAGILFVCPPAAEDGSSLFTARIPRVCIGGRAIDNHPYATSPIHLSDQPVFDTLFRRFRAAGRNRIAGIAAHPETLERMCTMAVGLGFEARPEWWHFLPTDPFGAAAARRIVHLLGTLPPRLRPDCLLITDDNLVPPATSGILDAQWARADLEVAAHANFPLVTRAAVPCLRYGLDAGNVLNAAAIEIARLNAGAAPQRLTVPFTVPGSTA